MTQTPIHWPTYLQPGDGAMDIGANVGVVAKQMALAVGEGGYVLAVEPSRENAEKLYKLAALVPQVHVSRVAVTDQDDDSVGLHLAQDGSHNSFWAPNIEHPRHVTMVVPTATVDRLAGLVPRLRVIKVDTQGAEALVLAGAEDTLKRGLVWCVEVWPFGLKQAGSSVEAVLDVFRQAGYQPHNHSYESILALTYTADHGSTDIVFSKG